MYDIRIFSAVIFAADRFKGSISFGKFLNLFMEEQHEQIVDVLSDMGYIAMAWPEVYYSSWTGRQDWEWI